MVRATAATLFGLQPSHVLDDEGDDVRIVSNMPMIGDWLVLYRIGHGRPVAHRCKSHVRNLPFQTLTMYVVGCVTIAPDVFTLFHSNQVIIWRIGLLEQLAKSINLIDTTTEKILHHGSSLDEDADALEDIRLVIADVKQQIRQCALFISKEQWSDATVTLHLLDATIQR